MAAENIGRWKNGRVNIWENNANRFFFPYVHPSAFPSLLLFKVNHRYSGTAKLHVFIAVRNNVWHC